MEEKFVNYFQIWYNSNITSCRGRAKPRMVTMVSFEFDIGIVIFAGYIFFWRLFIPDTIFN